MRNFVEQFCEKYMKIVKMKLNMLRNLRNMTKNMRKFCKKQKMTKKGSDKFAKHWAKTKKWYENEPHTTCRKMRKANEHFCENVSKTMMRTFVENIVDLLVKNTANKRIFLLQKSGKA